MLDILGNHAEAIEYYNKALAIDPKNVLALYNKGVALDKLGDHAEAIEYYNKALAIDPKDIAALDDKALILYALKYH